MPHADAPAASTVSALQSSPTGKPLTPSALATDGAAAFEKLRTAIAEYQAKPELAESISHLRDSLLLAAEVVSRIPKRTTQEPLVGDARALLREISVSGAHDLPVTLDQLATCRMLIVESWPGLLGAMMLVPAWQWPDAPALEKVPDWLWGDYTAWLFAAPQGFCALGQAEVYANHILQRLDELHRWVERNAGSAAVRAALEAYVQNASGIPLYFSHQSLRQHAELRGKLLARAFTRKGETYDPYAEPRTADRKLRVGFVNRHFGSQTETYTTIPSFEQLDPSRFDVILFANHSKDSTLENYCRDRAREFYILPQDLAGQLSTLRAAALDVVVFGTNVTAVVNEITLLALHRVAPLQVVNNSSCITSGLPEIDLYVSGTLTEIPEAGAHFTERLGLLPGPAHAFNYEIDRQEPTTTWTREGLGLPANAKVFVTAANYFKIIPEMQHAWARLLAATPDSYLLVHPFNPNWSSSYPIQRFCAEFDRTLKEHGVDGSRLVISTARFPSRNDVKELLRVGDVYLDTYPFGGVNSLVDPLELGMPVVAWEGDTFRSRMGGALLRALGVPELITTDEASYNKLALRLANDAMYRETVAVRIREAMERQPIFLDSLAASDAFGDLIETAYDEVALGGRSTLRAEATPLLAANSIPDTDLRPGSLRHARLALRTTPNDTKARHAVGKVYLDLGEYARAADYLLAAVQNDEGNAGLWYDLSIALHRNGQTQHAIQALEGSLRIDQNQLEAWLLLAQLAKAVDQHDMAREAATVAQSLAPRDPRISAYL